jgi:hypothetical protein
MKDEKYEALTLPDELVLSALGTVVLSAHE